MRPFQSELVRPEHTGANRCWPCTAVNLALLAAGCLVLVAVSPVASVLLAVVGTAAVRLRGYLVPYTPRFAPRLVQHLPWNPFHVGAGNPQSPGLSPTGRPSSASGGEGTGDGATDTDPTAADDGEGRSDGRDGRRERTPATLADATTADGEAILSGLVAAGVVAATGEDVHFASAFGRRWQAEIEALRERSPSALADAMLAAAPTAERARAVTERDRDYVVLFDGSGPRRERSGCVGPSPSPRPPRRAYWPRRPTSTLDRAPSQPTGSRSSSTRARSVRANSSSGRRAGAVARRGPTPTAVRCRRSSAWTAARSSPPSSDTDYCSFLPPVGMKSRFRVSDEPEYVGRCGTIYSNPYESGPSAPV